MASYVHSIKRCVCEGEVKLPLFEERVRAGFPSPADDHVEKRLDLNDLLISHPTATYYVRVAGDSMTNAGIHSGDILIVDRALEARDGKIVIAALNGELTVKRIERYQGRLYLTAENPDYEPILIEDYADLTIWGVVTYVLHKPE